MINQFIQYDMSIKATFETSAKQNYRTNIISNNYTIK